MRRIAAINVPDLPVSASVVVIFAIALISSVLVVSDPPARPRGLLFWLFSPDHRTVYEPIVREHNAAADRGEALHLPITMRQLVTASLEQRVLGAGYADLPIADLLEIERMMIGKIIRGPLESVPLVDLTDRLRAEGLLDDPTTGRQGLIPAASFGAWSTRGRAFGIPHDVHPVALAYRVDLIRELGMDPAEMEASIETWDDFVRVLSPLMRDEPDPETGQGDGVPEHRLLAFSPTHKDKLEIYLLQAGGGFFEPDGRLMIDAPINAEIFVEMGTWLHGPNPHSEQGYAIAADVKDFDPIGNSQKIEGRALFYVMPDWMAAVWKRQLPQLAGKVRLMPMPAWRPGGRRTSVWGGTMLGISATTEHVEEAWQAARALYLSEEAAIRLYRQGDIITPVREHWDHPVYAEPDPYFVGLEDDGGGHGQQKALLYISMADDVPRRVASPFYSLAVDRGDVAMQQYSEWVARPENRVRPREAKLARAQSLLDQAAEYVRGAMRRNEFHADLAGSSHGSGGDAPAGTGAGS